MKLILVLFICLFGLLSLYIVYYMLFKKKSDSSKNIKKSNIKKAASKNMKYLNYYQEKTSIISMIKPFGIWTKMIMKEKYDLINFQLNEYDNEKGYYENLVIAQRKTNKKHNRYYR